MRKRSQKTEGHDERIEAALEDFHKKKFKPIRAAAKAHGISEATLRARKNGQKSQKVQEIESDADDNSSYLGSDLVLPPEIFNCVVVSEQ